MRDYPVTPPGRALRPGLQVYGVVHSLWLNLQLEPLSFVRCGLVARYSLAANRTEAAELAGEPVEHLQIRVLRGPIFA